jgi:hypothetical protein
MGKDIHISGAVPIIGASDRISYNGSERRTEIFRAENEFGNGKIRRASAAVILRNKEKS